MRPASTCSADNTHVIRTHVDSRTGTALHPNLRVLVHVVDTLDVLQCDDTGAIAVHDVEGLGHHGTPPLVQVAAQTSQELVVVDVAVLRAVKEAKQRTQLRLCEEAASKGEGLGELFSIQLLVA
jgi:hypothetical protein